MRVTEAATPPPLAGRGRLVAILGASVLAIVVVTVTLTTVTEPLVHGWNDTVGFTAGLITAAFAVAAVLRLGDPDKTPPRTL